MVDMALRETIHILAQHSTLCKDIEETREKLIMLGLTEKEADALIERQYVIGYDIAENEDIALNTNCDVVCGLLEEMLKEKEQ